MSHLCPPSVLPTLGFEISEAELMGYGRTGLCASDKMLIRDEMAALGAVMQDTAKGIAGHEGAGTVVAVGEAMKHKWKVGDRYVALW